MGVEGKKKSKKKVGGAVPPLLTLVAVHLNRWVLFLPERSHTRRGLVPRQPAQNVRDQYDKHPDAKPPSSLQICERSHVGKPANARVL
jgi:hypothetical protein